MIGTLAQVAQSAPVTQWPLRVALVGLMVGLIALVLLGMRRGWKARAARQGDLPLPPADGLGQATLGPVPGVFVGTSSAGDWLDRVVVHDLGVRSRADLLAGPSGVLLERTGARDGFVPRAALRGARADRGVAGKAYERDGVLVLTWELGGRLVDTGFRADVAAEQAEALAALETLAADGRMP
ncbi:MAG: hypothetical protein ACKOT0_07375 [bacterium]